MQQIKTLPYLLLFALFSCHGFAQINSEKFRSADVVLVGQIKDVPSPIIKDLGSWIFQVEIEIDTIIKQNTHVNVPAQSINWVVSNLRYPQDDPANYVKKYAGKTCVFLLNRDHLGGNGDELDSQQVYFLNDTIMEQAIDLAMQEKFRINYWQHKVSCNQHCSFCMAVEKEQWKKVERKLRKNARHAGSGLGGVPLNEHRNVKYVLPIGTVLASLPTYGTKSICFITGKGECIKQAHYKIGVIKYLFCIHLYENVDALKLIGFSYDSNYMKSRLYGMRMNQKSRFHMPDSVDYPTWNPPDAFYLLQYINEGNQYYFNKDGKILTPGDNAFTDSLAANQKIISLCMLNLYPDFGVRNYALHALKQLNNPKALPFLLEMARFYTDKYMQPRQAHALEYQNYLGQLVATIDHISKCYTPIPFGSAQEQIRLSIGLAYWPSKFILSSNN